jgi:hypothetical protein
MPFGTETPLRNVFQHIRESARDPQGKMIPIYVDPIGLQEAEKTLDSPILIQLEDVPVRTTLRLILRQLNLIYKVEDGMLKITAEQSEPAGGSFRAGGGGGGLQ